ncbi:MAG: AMP-binding protein, partial [Alkalispirochaeta sp.]
MNPEPSGSSVAGLSTADLFRIVRDILADELRRSRPGRFDPLSAREWTPGTEVRADGLGLDSFERFTVAGRLNETFALFESGVEDNLLRARTLADTVEVIRAGLDHYSESIAFYSGGTTGVPKPRHHAASLLEQEITVHASIFASRRRVIVTVPVHHIYGFLFGVLLPATLGVPAVDAQGTLLTGDARPRDGDLVVSVPFLWERLLTGISRWGEDVVGVSSTAPLPPATARAGCTGENAPGAGARGSRGLARFIEVYGSSETAGIGWRDHCAALPAATTPGFTLFPYWSRAGASEEDSRLHRSGVSREIPASDETGVTHGPTPPDEPGSAGASTTHDATAPPDELLRTNPDGSTSRLPLPDRVEWIDDRTIIPVGRRDAVVQVGGENVDLEELRSKIRDILDDIADCAVRLGGDGRIRLFVVPAPGAAARL